MSHEGSCYCPNCDRSFDRDALEAQLAELRAANASLAAEIEDEDRELAESVRALAVSQGEVERLQGELDRSGRDHGKTIDQRDAREDQLEQAAALLGCDEEWSSLHDHGVCAIEAARGADESITRLRGALERARALLDRWLVFGAPVAGDTMDFLSTPSAATNQGETK